MCGIVSYVGRQPALPILVEGLRRLEYRGYDSAGVAMLNGGLHVVRAVGKIAALETRLREEPPPASTCGIAHTRWATHGKPSLENAHPHTDCGGEVAVIHNGIIENHAHLRAELESQGHRFRSETDTEVVAHLVERELKNPSGGVAGVSPAGGNLETAVKRALKLVRGAFGLAIVCAREPGKIVAARRGSPLVIGVGKGEMFLASDVSALLRHTRQVIYLEDDDVATLTADGYAIEKLDGAAVARPTATVEWDVESAEKGGHPHFMLKEILEQPETIRNAQRGRTIPSDGLAKLGGLESVLDELKKKRRLVIVSCGTSYYAGLTGRYIFEEMTDLSVEVELASEFRYRKLNIGEESAVLAISQSGETADTLAAIREAKRKGALVLGLCNVVGSSIARETAAGVYNHAGPEIGVASTKAFTSQLTILVLMGLLLGRHRNMSVTEGRTILAALAEAPEKVARILARREQIQAVAKKYAKVQHFIFVGRKLNYPVALEAALKLKEIAYVHAEGYAAGELKHGPIALLDESYTCVGIVPRDDMYEKVLSNMQEMKARGARIIAIAHEGDAQVKKIADDVIEIPETIDLVTPILAVVPLQLFAYFYAAENGREIDKPRNLAKSVTVE